MDTGELKGMALWGPRRPHFLSWHIYPLRRGRKRTEAGKAICRNCLLPNLYLLPAGLKVMKLCQVERQGLRTHLRLPHPV